MRKANPARTSYRGTTDAYIRNRQTSELIVLFTTGRAHLLKTAFRIVRDLHDAEDIVQTSFVLAWKGLTSFGERSSMKTWIKAIIVNQSLSALRVQRRRFLVSIDGEPDRPEEDSVEIRSSVDVEADTVRLLSAQLMHTHLRALPEHFQTVLRLRYFEGCTVKEIALQTSRSEPAIKSILYRGMRLLRERLPAANCSLHAGHPHSGLHRGRVCERSAAKEEHRFEHRELSAEGRVDLCCLQEAE